MPICTICKKNKKQKSFYVRKKENRYRTDCKECVKIRSKIYFNNTPIEKRRSSRTKWRNTWNGLYCNYRSAAREKNLPFRLGGAMFIECLTYPCEYCGVLATPNNPHGLDRKDNSNGYVVGNVVISCWKCNKLKAANSKDDFLNHCKKIVEYQQKKGEKNVNS